MKKGRYWVAFLVVMVVKDCRKCHIHQKYLVGGIIGVLIFYFLLSRQTKNLLAFSLVVYYHNGVWTKFLPFINPVVRLRMMS